MKSFCRLTNSHIRTANANKFTTFTVTVKVPMLFNVRAATHPWDVGDDFEGDSAAGDVAARGHPLQQALSKTLRQKVTWQM